MQNRGGLLRPQHVLTLSLSSEVLGSFMTPFFLGKTNMAGYKKGAATGGKKKGAAMGGKSMTMKQKMAKMRKMKKPTKRA